MYSCIIKRLYQCIIVIMLINSNVYCQNYSYDTDLSGPKMSASEENAVMKKELRVVLIGCIAAFLYFIIVKGRFESILFGIGAGFVYLVAGIAVCLILSAIGLFIGLSNKK